MNGYITLVVKTRDDRNYAPGTVVFAASLAHHRDLNVLAAWRVNDWSAVVAVADGAGTRARVQNWYNDGWTATGGRPHPMGTLLVFSVHEHEFDITKIGEECGTEND